MTRYRCLIEIEGGGGREMNFRVVRAVTEDSDDPAALARRNLRRVAAARRRTLALRDLRATVLDASRPGFERLVLRGYDDDDLEAKAATAIAEKILGTTQTHMITIPGGFADYLEGTGALQDAPEPVHVQLRALWVAAARRKAGRSSLTLLGAAAVHLEIVADHAETVLAGGGEFTRPETSGAQDVIRQINALLGQPHYR